MTQQPDRSTSASWARFRFSVVGSLLSSPPARGQLKRALRALANKTYLSIILPEAGTDRQRGRERD